MRVLAAPDKFRGTLSAREAAAAIATGARRAGWECVELPLADGGEGTLDVLGGANETTVVTGPLGAPVEAAWRLEDDGTAVIEAAEACGLSLAGGTEGNDPLRATSRGVGELINDAVFSGEAHEVVVAVGGVASTDGGVSAISTLGDYLSVPVTLACDVSAGWLEAATVFAPQKGADGEAVQLLHERLELLAKRYYKEFGVDVLELPGAGAAGGLAGGLAALGATLVRGFDFVADRVDLDRKLAEADLVITGEGLVDATSLTGKVVGGVLERAAKAGVHALVAAGDVVTNPPCRSVSLVALCGRERALADTSACIAEIVEKEL